MAPEQEPQPSEVNAFPLETLALGENGDLMVPSDGVLQITTDKLMEPEMTDSTVFQIAPYTVKIIEFGTFKLDGGAMFGSVPKTLWSKRIKADEQNRISLAARGLLVESTDRKILIDTGFGEKWSDKQKTIFEFAVLDPVFNLDAITDVVLTHLHFDHAGGLTYFNQNEELRLTFPNANHHVQRGNYEQALAPGPREKASYLSDNVKPLFDGKLNLLNGSQELFPGIQVEVVEGHTRSMQWIKIFSEETTLAFPTDLIPTSHHVPPPFIMGYDLCARTTLEEKSSFLEMACREDWIVVFQHDPEVAAARLKKNQDGKIHILPVQ